MTQVERLRLVEEHLPLVERLAARVGRRIGGRVEVSELVSVGTLGLIEAALRYDGRSGNSFATFAFHRIRGSLFDALGQLGPLPRGTWRRHRDIQVRELLAEPIDLEHEPIDELLDRRRAASRLDQALAKLPARQRKLLRRCYFSDTSLKDAGQEIGVSKSWASRLHARALRALRREMSELAADTAL